MEENNLKISFALYIRSEFSGCFIRDFGTAKNRMVEKSSVDNSKAACTYPNDHNYWFRVVMTTVLINNGMAVLSVNIITQSNSSHDFNRII